MYIRMISSDMKQASARSGGQTGERTMTTKSIRQNLAEA